jgi:hypothetical protein
MLTAPFQLLQARPKEPATAVDLTKIITINGQPVLLSAQYITQGA